STKPFRESHVVSKAMHRRGLRMIPVNPSYAGDCLWGERVYASLSDIPEPIDIVDVYRRPEHTPAIAQEAVSIGARALWLQLGIQNDEAAAIASAGGLMVIQNLCIAVAHTMLVA
ncbi:MAG: CoA-binding protein, partial [Myxococcota bacterium]